MKKLKHYCLQHHSTERRWVFPVAVVSLLSFSFILFLAITPTLPFYLSSSSSTTTTNPHSLFVESKLHPLPLPPSSPQPQPPRLAYLISGSAGDAAALKRTLSALYHPRNRYVVHLDLDSSVEERRDLQSHVESNQIFRRFGNVRMITRANLVTYRGPTMVANTLHAAAILLSECNDWDWFINLSASDYPLVTQDGSCLFIFQNVPLLVR